MTPHSTIERPAAIILRLDDEPKFCAVDVFEQRGGGQAPPLRALLVQRKRHFPDQDPDDATDIPDEQGI